MRAITSLTCISQKGCDPRCTDEDTETPHEEGPSPSHMAAACRAWLKPRSG